MGGATDGVIGAVHVNRSSLGQKLRRFGVLGSSSLAAGAQPLARNSGTLVAAGCTGRRAETVGRHREGRLSVQGARRPPKYPGKARVGYLTPRRLRAEPPSCQLSVGSWTPRCLTPAAHHRSCLLQTYIRARSSHPNPLALGSPFIAISSTIPLSSPLIHLSVHSAAH